jgi:hypothetical protein
VLDFIGIKFCLRNGQFVENGVVMGCLACQDALINKDIHKLCGYRKKWFEIRDLESLTEGRRVRCALDHGICGQLTAA